MLALADYQQLLDRAPVMLWRGAPGHCCDYVSAGWLRFTGQTDADLTGLRWLDGVHPEDAERCRAAIEQGRAFTIEYRRRRHDGVWRWIAEQVVPLDEARPEAGVVGAAMDIQEWRDVTDDREHRLAAIAHELRGPLHGLTVWLELLRRASGDGEARIHATGKRLVQRFGSLVADLVDFSRSERGHALELAVEPLELSELVDSVVGLYRAVLDARVPGLGVSHTVQVDVDGDHYRVRGDRARLEQVVQNLIENAIKFSPRGGEVRLELKRDAGTHQLHVSDHGIGVAASDLPHLRERFFRAGNATGAHIPGTGLGLSIIEEIVTAHGGRLDIVSELDVGTTVIVSLPAERPG